MEFTCDMCESFYNARAYANKKSKTVVELKTEESDWITLQNIINVYKLCKSFTVRMQESNI